MNDQDDKEIMANFDNAIKALKIANQQMEAALARMRKPKKPKLTLISGDKDENIEGKN